MVSQTRQFVSFLGSVFTGPLIISVVVFAHEKNNMKIITIIMAGFSSAFSRDGPIIFHMRDGPPSITGSPGGTDPPCQRYYLVCESGPP